VELKVHVSHRLDSLDFESECNEIWQVNGIIPIFHYVKAPDEKTKRELPEDNEARRLEEGLRVKVKVIGVKVLVSMQRLCQRHLCAKYKRLSSICIGARINFRNLNTVFET